MFRLDEMDGRLVFAGLAIAAVGAVLAMRASQSGDLKTSKPTPKGYHSMDFMPPLPPNVIEYKRTRDFTESNLPAALLKAHTTKKGTWGKIMVESGNVAYRILDPDSPSNGKGPVGDDAPSEITSSGTGAAGNGKDKLFYLEPGIVGVIEPQAPHQVELLGPVKFHVMFMHVPTSGPESNPHEEEEDH